MAQFETNPILEALEDLLERERAVILSGDLDGLARMAARKTALFGKLPAAAPRTDIIERLRVQANRNQQLLTAAAQGVKAASRGLQALLKPDQNQSTYGRDGARTVLSAPATGVNLRA